MVVSHFVFSFLFFFFLAGLFFVLIFPHSASPLLSMLSLEALCFSFVSAVYTQPAVSSDFVPFKPRHFAHFAFVFNIFQVVCHMTQWMWLLSCVWMTVMELNEWRVVINYCQRISWSVAGLPFVCLILSGAVCRLLIVAVVWCRRCRCCRFFLIWNQFGQPGNGLDGAFSEFCPNSLENFLHSHRKWVFWDRNVKLCISTFPNTQCCIWIDWHDFLIISMCSLKLLFAKSVQPVYTINRTFSSFFE